ncbi:CHASE2 domain-containing protein [Phyllobacterium sp. SYP-B3895]|uniref:CHASE2 domain-containing protein n=1 Tax=Phyllobacterium sp. SYP-B3895 TaxID=2663240 RepID=UPI001299FE5D|nr:adenylate/guanylate cyclase domain-containing protein [Phyllobacterium sp. SYP-B3895]MRG58159.1 CHASE2 domain-containing protein [Phyllobacterium sp. SYP-B3895]
MSGRALQTLIALVVAGIWGAGLGLAHLRGDMWFIDRVEATMTDLRTVIRGQKPAPDVVTIVAIDDEVVRQTGSYPLARAKLAELIDAIAALKPKVIGVDTLLVDPGPAEGDQRLVQSLAKAPVVLAAAAVFPQGQQLTQNDAADPLSGVPDAERFLLPLPVFGDVAATGVVNVSTDRNGTPRLVPMLFKSGGDIEASFPLRVVSIAKGVEPAVEPGRLLLGDEIIRTDIGQALPLSFYGTRGSIRTISAADVLAGKLSRESIENRIVVIGTTVTGGGDVFPTPFDPVLPGVEVVSTAITHLMNGGALIRDRTVRLVDAGFAAALPVILVSLLAWRRNAIGLIAALCVVLAWFAFNLTAFFNGIWLSAAVPLVAAIPPALAFGATQLWIGRRRAQHFAEQSKLLQQVQAPGLGNWLARNPDFLAAPVRQDAAVVFVDLSGFTGLSETLGPNATRELLNGFYQLVDEEVAASSGSITSFMGDGAMILFGLPASSPDDALNAAHCCVGLCDRMRAWLDGLPEAVSSRIGFKVGAHFGTIVASRLGSGMRQQITATGDTVNIASRLMEVAASNGAELALSEEILRAAGEDADPFKSGILRGPLETRIRGRAGSIAIWLWRGTASDSARGQIEMSK